MQLQEIQLSYYSLFCVDWKVPGKNPEGGHSNTSVVHMRDQRFSKHKRIAISRLQEKHSLTKNFAQFLEDMFELIESKRTPLSKVGTF